MPSPITTQDLQKRYDEELAIKELSDRYHGPHSRSSSPRECISCLKRAIAEVDKDESIYANHWLEAGGTKIFDTADGGMVIGPGKP